MRVNCDSICVSNSVDQLYDMYSQYLPLWDISETHFVGGVRSQMNLCAWREMLTGREEAASDPDAHFLLDGITHGFKLVDPGSVIHPYVCANYKSATVSAKQEISEIICDELSSGKLSIVSSTPHCIHALGAVEKKGGSFRPITDASRPSGASINSFMEATFQTFKYKTIDTVSAVMQPLCYMAVTDITSAYRSILIRESDRKFQGLQWDVEGTSCYLEDNFLAFGTRMSPSVFTRITDAVSRHMESRGYFCANYLDDFLVMGRDFTECQQAQLYLHKVLRRLGFYISYKKVRSPAQIQTYLGVELDSIQMKLRLPDDKIASLHHELEFFAGRLRATKKQLQHLCGILAHCSTLVRGGRTFSHRVIEMLSHFTPGKNYISLSKSFRADLMWWTDFAAWFNGEAKIIKPGPMNTAVIHTDAASTIGWGAVYGDDWTGGSWSDSWNDDRDCHSHCAPTPDIDIPCNINVQELYPVLMALKRWGGEWRDTRIECVTDNTQVVAALNTGKSDNERSMEILRLIFWDTVLFNCHLVGVFLPGYKNVVADAVSRAKCFDDIPFHLCCRDQPVRQGPRHKGHGTEVHGMVGFNVENKDLPVEEIPRILRASRRYPGAHQA